MRIPDPNEAPRKQTGSTPPGKIKKENPKKKKENQRKRKY
jgi:hypothetical protein